MRALRGVADRAVGLGLLGMILCGCSMLPPPERFGIRPDEPVLSTAEDPCVALDQYVKYVQELQEAYHSRASQNRGWIYVAAILGLAVAAAAGGLGIAAAASAGTIALLTLSGGLGTGFFTIINNSELAQIYTISANDADAALNQSSGKSPVVLSADPKTCAEALTTLRNRVAQVRMDLETARTDSAKAAVMRAAAQQEALSRQIAALGLIVFEVTPTKDQLAPGDVAVVTLRGGRPDYTATPVGTGLRVTEQPTKDNNYQATVAASKDAKPGEEYQVVFQDRERRTKVLTFRIASTSKAPAPLAVTPLPSGVVAPGGVRTVVFVVSGGLPPYRSIGPEGVEDKSRITVDPQPDVDLKSEPPVIKVKVEGGEPGKTYAALVRDSAGKEARLAVKVATLLQLQLLPDGKPTPGTLTIPRPATASAMFRVKDGEPKYTVQGPTGVTPAPGISEIATGIFRVDANAALGSYVVTDSSGQFTIVRVE